MIIKTIANASCVTLGLLDIDLSDLRVVSWDLGSEGSFLLMFTLWGGIETLKLGGLEKWQQLKCPSADEWRNRMWHYRHRTEYYSVINKKE